MSASIKSSEVPEKPFLDKEDIYAPLTVLSFNA